MKSFIKRFVPVSTWSRLSGVRWAITREVQRWVAAARVVGTLPAITILSKTGKSASITTASKPTYKVRRLTLKGYRYPVYYRPGTSDIDVIHQVFVDRQYDCVGNESDVKLIIDCGANVGCTSFYFLNNYPDAHIIVVEPDPQNFAICRKNLAPFGERVTLVNTGVWPVSIPLKVERGKFADGREWAIQVRPAAVGEVPDLIATTLEDLIARSGFDAVDILKIDIEGSEIALFSEGAERWLSRTRHIAIELHGQHCERVFINAMSRYEYSLSAEGELVVCKDIQSPLVAKI
jgi:FkbM family methyltransferase